MNHALKYLFPALLLAVASITQAQEEINPFGNDGGFMSEEQEKTTVKLIAEQQAVAAGDTLTIGIQLTHAPGWHSYFKNPGGPGLPLKFSWDLPEGYALKALRWPTPHLYDSEGTQFYVYEGTYTILADISVPESATPGTTTLKVTPEWQLCNDKGCLPPDSKDFSIEATIADTTQPNSTQEKFFSEARTALPLTDSPWDVSVAKQGTKFTIELTSDNFSSHDPGKPTFVSTDMQTNGTTPQSVESLKNGYRITVSSVKSDPNGGDVKPLDSLSGILIAPNGWSSDSKAQGLTVNQAKFESKPLESAGLGTFLGIIGGMLLGGLILNLMPCVFPVIGLKIMGFAQQAGEDKKKVVMHGIAFAAGVLISFWVLAGFLLSLRNKALEGAGEDVGWGYQLQNPYIVLSILLLMFILALNMFGVFEIGTGATGVGGNLQNKQGLQGSFFSGVLATIVATPCSAPFLGAAIGAAFALPNIQFMLAFTAMALGLALPYLFLSIFPHLVEKLPRPGPWMESFKQAMSFLLFATAGYLLWVYVAQTGLDFMLDVVIGLSLIAIGVWIYGRWNQPHRSGKARTIAKALAIIALVGGIFITLPPDKDNQIKWEKWSAAKVEELHENGTPVYVDFTATWCATCQVNKKNAYPPEVVKLFKEYGIVALKADKTNPDPEIEKKLQELGRTAIPVNVLYIPGKDEPIITPELLTASYMKQLITENLEKPTEE